MDKAHAIRRSVLSIGAESGILPAKTLQLRREPLSVE